jgi:co-chaperonin GroES (HSP10)
LEKGRRGMILIGSVHERHVGPIVVDAERAEAKTSKVVVVDAERAEAKTGKVVVVAVTENWVAKKNQRELSLAKRNQRKPSLRVRRRSMQHPSRPCKFNRRLPSQRRPRYKINSQR